MTWTSQRALLVLSPDLNDSSSWWRAWGPANALQREVPNLALMAVDMGKAGRIDWNVIDACSAAFMNRPHKQSHAGLIDYLIQCHRPTWVDFDDCIWEIPTFNAAHERYRDEDKTGARLCAERAEIVTASTPRLAEYLQGRQASDAQVYVVPNVFPDWYRWSNLERKKEILWRGGTTHLGDADSVARDVEALSHEFPEWTWVFFGTNPWTITRYLDPACYRLEPERSLHIFHQWLRQQLASVMMVPLIDCTFNRCKSSISWMEGTLCGAVVVAPDFEEFDRPGCLRYSEKRPFMETMREAITASDEDRKKLVQESREWIDAHARTKHAMPIRKEIIEALITS